MYEHYLQQESQAAFKKARSRGRKELFSLNPLKHRKNRILTLEMVLEHAEYGGESYVGIKEVPVRKIIGTENRSNDYSRSFYPLKNWMQGNWAKIYELMSTGTIFEPVKLIEYGGYYFVRDGNHRITVAKYSNREYVSAEVVRFTLPFSLPRDLHIGNLKLLSEKYRFHQKTGVFDILSENEFFVRCPATWRWLTTELCDFNRAWFIRKFGRAPKDMNELVESWYRNLYRNAIRYIRNNSLTYLFPGRLETDIFIELIKLWNSYDNPDSLWLGEIYKLFIQKHSRFHFLRMPLQRASRKAKSLFASPEEEYKRFAEISQIEDLVPQFPKMEAPKGFYTFLYYQLVHSYAPHLKERYGRAPYIQELTVEWYNSLFNPVYDVFMQSNSEADFPRIYQRFSKKYYRDIIKGKIEVDEALHRFFDA